MKDIYNWEVGKTASQGYQIPIAENMNYIVYEIPYWRYLPDYIKDETEFILKVSPKVGYGEEYYLIAHTYDGKFELFNSYAEEVSMEEIDLPEIDYKEHYLNQ